MTIAPKALPPASPPSSPTNMNAVLYVEVLTRERLLKPNIRVHPAIATNWWLHHDSAPSHTAFRIVEYLAQHNVTALPHPPTAPNWLCQIFFCSQE
ncbi:hypothetical protein TNIN_261241 [Trichonephila inaurata madagascariensis]|uniref:Transposase n=1 Tax=Trichonephila inaurata madagascariensis TaxID=2747483 RepID=A0A8X6IE65_9ARAC|nr:hypothetical protein TNIN_261241 [Trichonephila inaurata madagascariensis]